MRRGLRPFPIRTPAAHAMFTSRYYLQDEAAALMAWHADREIVRPPPDPAVSSYARGVILPLRRRQDQSVWGGVCDSQLRHVAGYARSHGHELVPGDFYIEIRGGYTPDQVTECDEEVIYAGAIYLQFGHFLLESVCRLWYALAHPELQLPLAFCCYPPDGADDDAPLPELPEYIGDFLELAGLDPGRVLLIRTPTRFRRVIVPHQDRHIYDAWYPGLCEPLLQAVSRRLPSPPAGAGRQIYLSRRHFHRHDVFGEEYFEEFFARHGFEILYPEEMPLAAQLAAVQGADRIACTLGTLSHSALWARPGTSLICLLRTGIIHQTHLIQQNINRIRHLDYVFVDTSANLFPARHDTIQTVFIIAPTPCWREFVRREYAEEVDIDLCRHLTAPEFGLADYLRQYLNYENVMHNCWHVLDPAAYLQSLQAAFMPERCALMQHRLQAAARMLFSGRDYELLNARGQRLCVVRMLDDGQLQLLQGSLGIAVVRWRYNEPDQLLHWYNMFLMPLISFRLVSVVDPLGRFSPADLTQPPLLLAGAAPQQLMLRALAPAA